MGMILEVCHYPPGTSKWNRIEQRDFCHQSRNRLGRPLGTAEIDVESVDGTRTTTGLERHTWFDENTYDKGRKITDKQLADRMIFRNEYHGEWNCELLQII